MGVSMCGDRYLIAYLTVTCSTKPMQYGASSRRQCKKTGESVNEKERKCI